MTTGRADELTVVIPTSGRPVLRDTLAALAGTTVRPGRVVVVDQSASPAIATIVREAAALGLAATHQPSDEVGPGAARNRGVEHVASRYVAFVDDDCCPATDWTERVLDRLQRHPGTVVTGRVESASDDTPSLMVAADAAVYRRPLWDRDPLFAGNMALERALFEAVGPFSEHPALLPAAEDNEWGYRAQRNGVAIVYAPEAAVRHLDWRDETALADVRRRYARGQGGFYGLYIRRGDLFLLGRAAREVAQGAWLLVRGALTRQPRLRARARAQLVDLPLGLVAGLAGVSPGRRRRTATAPRTRPRAAGRRPRP